MKSVDPKIPDVQALSAVAKFCLLEDPYQPWTASIQSLFAKAIQQQCHWHMERSPFYRQFLRLNNFDIEQLDLAENWRNVPYIPSTFFKWHEQKSLTDKNPLYLHLTSSGTSGQKSQVFFDQWSLTSAQKMVENIFRYYQWLSDKPTNYLLYSYEPQTNLNLGTSFTDHYLCDYAPVHRVEHALKCTGSGGHEFDVFGCIRALQDYAQEEKPVRIFGFPAFLYQTIERIRTRKMPPLRLHPESLVFLGGGWKSQAAKEINKITFYQEVNQMLGIPMNRIRDGYGSIEHCVPYIECEKQHFHIPVWSRVLIRRQDNLQIADYGEPGLLQFISAHMTSMPLQSVLTSDVAVLHSASEGHCQIATDWFQILGRAGKSQSKSCAVAASELIRSST